MTPSGIAITQSHFKGYWLLTGAKNSIDLRRMSTDDRRDFRQGTSGRHMALDKETCFLEVPFTALPVFSYLLTIEGCLAVADYRNAGDVQFSGQFYSDNHALSQDVFIQNSGVLTASGCDALLRYSAAAMNRKNERREVLALFPSARAKLSLLSIEALGDESPPIPIVFFDGTTSSSEQFYK